jgi:hypothetical protein
VCGQHVAYEPVNAAVVLHILVRKLGGLSRGRMFFNSYINQKEFAKEIGAGGAGVKLPILGASFIGTKRSTSLEYQRSLTVVLTF